MKIKVNMDEVREVLSELDVGESFTLPMTVKQVYFNVASLKSGIALREQKKFVQRKIDENTFRVWRTA